MESSNIMPRQTTPLKDRDEQWGKNNIEYFLGLSMGNQFTNERLEIIKCYEAYFGTLDMNDYQYVIKPFGNKTPANIQLPADVRNFPIIKPIIDVLYGEYANFPKVYTVTVTDSDVESIKQSLRDEQVSEVAKQLFINKLNEIGIDTGKPSQQVQAIQDVVSKFDSGNYRDKRALTGQTALDYIHFQQEIPEKFKKGFLDFLISGYVYSLKDIISNDVNYEVLDPLAVDYDRDPNLTFVEDGAWATVRYRTTLAKIIEIFHDDLKPEIVVELEQVLDNQNPSTISVFPDDIKTLYKNHQNIEVCRVFWKSLKKLGYVRYTDETGKIQLKEVEEGYLIDKQLGDIDVEWQFIEEVWEGTRIAGTYYVRVRPCIVQRRDLDNPSICKLPVNGRSYYNRRTTLISLVKLGLPYQVTYNVYKYRLEQIIAKSKGMVLGINLKGKPDGWTMEEWMMYITELGFFVEDYDANNEPRFANQRAIDLSFSQSLRIHLELLQTILEEWRQAAGVPRQRLGEINSTETVGGVQKSISQSSLSTMIYSNLYLAFEQREYLGLLDSSKVAWIEGKKTSFYMPEYGQVFLDIDGYEHSETNYGVFVTNSSKEYAKVQLIQGLFKEMLSTGYSPSTVAEALDSENMSKIKILLKQAEESKAQLEQQMQQQQMQLKQQSDEAQVQLKMFEIKNENERSIQKNDTAIRTAEISALGYGKSTDSNNNKVPDVIDIANLALKEKQISSNNKNEAVIHELKKRELDLKEKQIKSNK